MRQAIASKIVNIQPLHAIIASFTIIITDVGGSTDTDFCPEKAHDHHGWESVWAPPGA